MSLHDEILKDLKKNGASTYWVIQKRINRSPYGVRNKCEDMVYRLDELVRLAPGGKYYARGILYAVKSPYGKGVCVQL